MNPLNIVTEFRFDIAHAVAGSQTLQHEVGKISDAASNALYSIQRIGLGVVAQMGFGTGGVLGALYAAIKASDKFAQSQIKLSNVMISNGVFTGENAFEKSMMASEAALNRMSKTARQFALPADAFVSLTSGIFAALSVKGLDDSRATKSTDLTRQFMKSAPILGIDAASYQGNLLNMVMGHASQGDNMTQRLMAETKAFEPFKGSLKNFNALPAAKRLDVLTKALGQFSSNTKVNEGMLNTLNAQMNLLKDNLTSMFSILRPIGDAIRGPIVKVMKAVNEYLLKHGEAAANRVSGIVKRIFDDPVAAYEKLVQLSRLKSDFKIAGQVAGLIGMFHGISWVMGLFGIKIGTLATALRSVLGFVGGLIAPLMNLRVLGFVFKFLGIAVWTVLSTLIPLVYFFQIISLAIGKTQVKLAAFYAQNLGKFVDMASKIIEVGSKIWKPIEMGMQFFADILSDIFVWILQPDLLIWFGDVFIKLLDIIELVSNGIIGVIAGISNALIGFGFDVANGNFMDAFKNLGQNYEEGRDEYWGMINGVKPMGEEFATSQKVTNINGDINITNNIKEQIEPDRIAFSLTQQIFKAAENPQQASGRGFNQGFGR